MKRIFLIIISSFFISNLAYGQEEILRYKRIFQTADSLNEIERITSLDSSVFKIAGSLNKKHPQEYFKASAELLKDSKYNEASFLYYLGYLRYRYYNSSNPQYSPSGDGALLASLKYVIGEPINLYLKTNIENFISILNASSAYHRANDYKFFPSKKNPEKYNLQAKGLEDFVADLKTNKVKYRSDWDEERKKYEAIIKETLEKK